MNKLFDHVGIDFGNYSIKAVELKNIHRKPTLAAFGKQVTAVAIRNSDNEPNQKKIVEALKLLYKNTKIKNKRVVIAIPESSVFTRFIDLPGLKEDEINTAVYYKAKQYIPLPLNEVNMSYIVLGFDKNKNSYNVLLVAAPKKIVNLYMNIAEKAGLDVLAVETESVAIGRTTFKATNTSHAVILNFGSGNTDMSIMYEGQMIFSQSIAIGADSLTQAIINQFGLDYQQAEQYKRTYGVKQGVLENKLYNLLKPILDAIIVEIQRGVEFYKTSTVRSAPSEYFLNGDAALLPGLVEFLKINYNIEAKIGDPWLNIKIPGKLGNDIMKDKPAYAVAVGLALKDKA